MSDWPIAELIPHSGDVILVDRIDAIDADSVRCIACVPEQAPWLDADGYLPAWVGPEMMAQAIAAWVGHNAREERRPVQVGFLLGTRHYACNVDRFAPGTLLQVTAHRSFHDDAGMGVFDCTIEGDGINASARLNVYRPHDTDAFLENLAGAFAHG